MISVLSILLGLLAGILGGLLGIGGGMVMIPGLVILLGFSQHQAQGTALAAMLPPVTLLAVIEYYRAGGVDTKISAWMALGLLAGGLIGAILANRIPDYLLRRIFGGFLFIIALKMLVSK